MKKKSNENPLSYWEAIIILYIKVMTIFSLPSLVLMGKEIKLKPKDKYSMATQMFLSKVVHVALLNYATSIVFSKVKCGLF